MALLKIENGPGKFDLMVALFNRKPEMTITLTIRRASPNERDFPSEATFYSGRQGIFVLQAVHKGADSDEDWLIEVTTAQDSADSSANIYFKGSYSTKTRKGFLETRSSRI